MVDHPPLETDIPKLRPPQIVTKARKEYDRVLAERLAMNKNGYSRAVKAAIRAYDKVLKDYDRQHRSENSAST